MPNRAYPIKPRFHRLLDKAIKEEQEQRDKEFRSWHNKVVEKGAINQRR